MEGRVVYLGRGAYIACSGYGTVRDIRDTLLPFETSVCERLRTAVRFRWAGHTLRTERGGSFHRLSWGSAVSDPMGRRRTWRCDEMEALEGLGAWGSDLGRDVAQSMLIRPEQATRRGARAHRRSEDMRSLRLRDAVAISEYVCYEQQ